MVRDVIRALGRRWYVLLVGLLLTAGLAYGAYSTTPPEYTARGLVLVLPSEDSIKAGGNPFLNLSGLEQPASIVVAYFASSTAKEEIANRAPHAEFEVALDSSTRGPVIAVDVTDKSSEETLSTLTYLMDQIPVQLQRLQQEVDAPAGAMVTSMQLVVDDSAEADRAGTIRTVIAAIVVGLAATGVAASMLDGLLLSRRARRVDLAGVASPPSDSPRTVVEKQSSDARSRRTRMGVSAPGEMDNPQRGPQVRIGPSAPSGRSRREN